MFSCTEPARLSKSDYNTRLKEFVAAYKVSFICGCMDGGFNNDLKGFLKSQNDLGLFSEIDQLGYFIVKEADSLGRIYGAKIEQINYEDAGYGKPIFTGCIYYGMSKEIDSTARTSFFQQYGKRK